jgi:hypothetical protein
LKKSFLLTCTIFILISCTEETQRSHLLEFKINNQIYSYEGYAFRYNCYLNNISKGYDWHVFNSGKNAIYIQTYDSTLKKYVYQYPSFRATFTVGQSAGESKTYRATTGELRLLGQEMGDLIGDFHFKMKNILDPLDSLMIGEGYFKIWLEYRDSVLIK